MTSAEPHLTISDYAILSLSLGSISGGRAHRGTVGAGTASRQRGGQFRFHALVADFSVLASELNVNAVSVGFEIARTLAGVGAFLVAAAAVISIEGAFRIDAGREGLVLSRPGMVPGTADPDACIKGRVRDGTSGLVRFHQVSAVDVDKKVFEQVFGEFTLTRESLTRKVLITAEESVSVSTLATERTNPGFGRGSEECEGSENDGELEHVLDAAEGYSIFSK